MIDQPAIHQTYELTQEERDEIWAKLHMATMKMYKHLRSAETHAGRMKHVDARRVCIGAVQGAISGCASASVYGVVIGAALGAVATAAGDACEHYFRMKDELKDADYWARMADALQEQLWRG